MKELADIRLAGESNRGLVRERNEDNFCWVACPGARAALAAVADGIGGYRDGDVASFVCCRRLLGAWRKLDAKRLNPDDATDFFRRELTDINRELFEHNRRERDGAPMGTTVAAAVFFAEEVVLVHAGDSRIYQFLPDTGLTQLTEDHTLLAKLAERGSRIASPPSVLGNVISRALGPRPRLELDLQRIPRPPRARYLLCSDGISRYLESEVIATALCESDGPRAAVNALMRAALIAGGRDNITVICAYPGHNHT